MLANFTLLFTLAGNTTMDEMKSRLDYSDLPPLNLDANKVVILGVGKVSSRQTNYVIKT